MPWGKMDDKFHRHAKVRALRRERGGREALGVWVFWWSWCLDDHELTGFVPECELPAPDAKAADLLVKHGLWEREEDGYRFHDFSEYNPTKPQIEAKKEADRKRIAEKRAAEKEASRENVARDIGSDTGASRFPARARGNSPSPSHPGPLPIPTEGECVGPPSQSLRSQMRLAWDACGILSPNDDRRIGEIEPKLVRLAGERSADPLALWVAAIRRIRADGPTKAKRMANLSVLCAQLEQWVDDAPGAPKPLAHKLLTADDHAAELERTPNPEWAQ